MDKLFEAIKSNDLEQVNKIISDLPNGLDFDIKTDNGEYTALMVACEYANLDIINALLNKGAEVGYEIKYCDNTVLKSLSRGVNSNIDILDALINSLGEKFMRYEATNNGNESAEDFFPLDGEPSLTPIELAEKNGKTDYLNKLKEYL